jgi:cysteine dioxygenase
MTATAVKSDQKITTLPELIEAIDQARTQMEYKQIVKRIAIPVEAFSEYTYWDDDTYTRNCIARTDAYELLLLCWDKKQDTPIHSHNSQECWVKVIEGDFLEKRFQAEEGQEEPELTHEQQFSDYQISYMNDEMGFHSLHNREGKRAMTLHLYTRPIDECTVYNEEEGEFETKELTYDTIEGEKPSDDN